MGITLDDVIADVTQETTLEQSIITLMNGISSQLGQAGTDQAKLSALKSQLDSNIAAMTAAVTANTPVSTASIGTGAGSAQASGSASADANAAGSGTSGSS